MEVSFPLGGWHLVWGHFCLSDIMEVRIIVRSCERNISWWTMLEEEENEVGKVVKRALSSQLLWFELAESTQASHHLTAVQHAFPFLFWTWMLILGRPVQQTKLASHVFGSPCASGVFAQDDSVSGRLLMSAQDFGCQTQEGLLFLCKASGVCVLPQIMPDETSLRALCMCAMHHWPSSVYCLCECSCKLLVHSTQTCWQHPCVRGWLGVVRCGEVVVHV